MKSKIIKSLAILTVTSVGSYATEGTLQEIIEKADKATREGLSFHAHYENIDSKVTSHFYEDTPYKYTMTNTVIGDIETNDVNEYNAFCARLGEKLGIDMLQPAEPEPAVEVSEESASEDSSLTTAGEVTSISSASEESETPETTQPSHSGTVPKTKVIRRKYTLNYDGGNKHFDFAGLDFKNPDDRAIIQAHIDAQNNR